ncbi:hypothetical protein DL766_000485 [Monosporascus sp. MC13-8B]|nr:hypothetical protein DL763_005599 [Monosporascus cannonballus]RYP39227.1 hypothetical protein DL766_000485 [Monosporascus sp. MC13-8B]
MPTSAGDPRNDGGSGNGPESRSGNPFIRFKNHVDDNIQRGFETWSSFLWTLPTTLDLHLRRQDDSSSATPVITRDMSPTAPRGSGIIPSSDHHEDGGSSESATDLDGVYNWAVHSPYSPLNLQHLRQPVPRDTPHYFHFSFTFPPWSSSSSSSSPSSDPQFTFRDAFEDLLFVSAGYPLPDVNGRLFGRAFEEFSGWRLFRLPGERGLHVADWTTKLGLLGLWHSYFPRLAVPEPERHEWGLSRDPWFAARRRWLQAAENSADGTGSKLMFKPSKDGFGGWDKVWGWGWNGKASNECPTYALGDEEEASPKRNAATPSDEGVTAPPPQQPETEEDLYSTAAAFAVLGGYQQPKAVIASADKTTAAAADQQQPMNSETTETTENLDGGRTIRTVRRHEDKASGRTEVTTTTERYDADDNLVSRSKSTTSTRTWSGAPGSVEGRWGGPVQRLDFWMGGKREDERTSNDGAEAKAPPAKSGQQKGGWFWH